jgi:hypothetical protein
MESDERPACVWFSLLGMLPVDTSNWAGLGAEIRYAFLAAIYSPEPGLMSLIKHIIHAALARHRDWSLYLSAHAAHTARKNNLEPSKWAPLQLSLASKVWVSPSDLHTEREMANRLYKAKI